MHAVAGALCGPWGEAAGSGQGWELPPRPRVLASELLCCVLMASFLGTLAPPGLDAQNQSLGRGSYSKWVPVTLRRDAGRVPRAQGLICP